MPESSTLLCVLRFTPIPYFFIPKILWFFFTFLIFRFKTASLAHKSQRQSIYSYSFCVALRACSS